MDTSQKVWWLSRKIAGVRVQALLDPYPPGSQFVLRGQGAYSARYVKEPTGLWSQMQGTTAPPHVYNMSADSLGFAVGFSPIRDALALAEELGTASPSGTPLSEAPWGAS